VCRLLRQRNATSVLHTAGCFPGFTTKSSGRKLQKNIWSSARNIDQLACRLGSIGGPVKIQRYIAIRLGLYVKTWEVSAAAAENNWRTYCLLLLLNRRLADGNVHCAGSATYQICFRLPIPNPNQTLNLNPNPITDPNPNPKSNKKQNDTGMKLYIELYLKVDFLAMGAGL